jgi:CheY-like chemotaxis protein
VATILVVDDSPLVLNLVRIVLSEAGHEVVASDNPLTVPTLVRRTAFDLALVDLNMPSIQGDTVITILDRAGLPANKVVLFSEAPEDQLKTKAAGCHAKGYIKKGTDEHLVSEVTRFLAM